jgi:hypothetical protein
VLLTESIQVNAASGGAVAFNSTINSEGGEFNNVTISGGDVSFDGDIGAGMAGGDQAIGSLTVTNGNSVTFGPTGGISQVRVDGMIDLGRDATLANGVTFDGGMSGLTISTTNDEIRIDGPVMLNGASTTLSTGAGAGDLRFTNNTPIDSEAGEGNNLTLSAGTGAVRFNEDIGNAAMGTEVGLITVTDADQVIFGESSVEIPAAGTGPVEVINAGLDIGSVTPITNGILLQPGGAAATINSNGTDIKFNGDVNIIANDVTISTGPAGGDIQFSNGLTPQGNGVTDLTLVSGTGAITIGDDLGSPTNLFKDITINNGGTLTFAPGADVNLDGPFTQNGGGDVVIGGNITTTNDAISFGQTTPAGAITMADGTVLDPQGNADIRARGTGNITVSRMVTGGTISLESTGGAIIDGGDLGGADLEAPQIALQAATGIGDDGAADQALSVDPALLPSASNPMIQGSAIDTLTNTIAASNSPSGDVQVSNTTGTLLTIGDVDGVSGVTNSGDGEIAITNQSPITVDSNVLNTGGGSIILTAVDNVAVDTDDLTLNAPVRASGGDGAIVLNAGDDILANSHIQTDDALIDGSSAMRAGNIDLNAGRTLTINDGPEIFDVQTGNATSDDDTPFDTPLLSNRQIRYTYDNSDSNNLTFADGALLATTTGVISGATPVIMNLETPDIRGDGTAVIRGDFGRMDEANFRILISWGDDSFSLDHVSAVEGTGEQSFEFTHQYNQANLPNPANAADPIEIRVFIQGAANILEVDANDEVVAPRIDSFTSVDASMSPYLAASDHFLLSEIFRDLAPSGRIDAFVGDDDQEVVQANQFSTQDFNNDPSEIVIPPATETPLPIIQDTIFERFTNQLFALVSDPNSGAGGGNNNFVGNNNGGAGSSTATVPGTGTSSESTAVFFIIQNDVVIVEFPEISGVVDTFQFLVAAFEQASSEFVVKAKTDDAAANERIVWLIVLDQNGKMVEEQPLSEEVLDDLPKRVFSRLPDGRYEVWLQEAGEKRRRLIIKVTIRDGKPADEVKRADQPKVDPGKEDKKQPEPDNQPNNGNGPPKPNGNDNDGAAALNGIDSNRLVVMSADNETSTTSGPVVTREDAFASWGRQSLNSQIVADRPEFDGSMEESNGVGTETAAKSDSMSHPAAASAVVAAGALLAQLKRDKWDRRVDAMMANWQDDQDTRNDGH